MKTLHFTYKMQLKFSYPVEKHHFTLRCTPATDEMQQVWSLDMDIFPKDYLSQSQDSFGNICVYGYSGKPHQQFSLTVTGKVRTGMGKALAAGPEYKVGMFKAYTDMTRPGTALTAYGKSLREEMEEQAVSGNFERARYVMKKLHEKYQYVPGITGVETTAEEAFCQGCGVCQDYSHIMLALCRFMKIPCRYVAGMLIGEGFSHAWVEVYEDGYWYGLDPTNDLLVRDGHIKIAQGRDFADCRLNQGLMAGFAAQTQTVSVLVEEY